MWIGVLSETCGVLNPEILDVFDGVDYILHCGNIGDPAILDTLSQTAPIAGVIGPQDDAATYPFERTLFRKWFDVGIYVTHRVGDPMNLPKSARKEVEEIDPQVVLFGSSYEPFNNRVEGRLFFNPGPAGKKKTKYPRSVGILELEGHSVRGEVVPLRNTSSRFVSLSGGA